MTHHDEMHTTRDVTERGIVSAIFDDAESAEEAWREAREIGLEDRSLTVVLSEQARDTYFPRERVDVEKERKTLEGTGVGGAVGLTVGAIAGAIAAIGTTVAVPGLGLVVAGPLAGALAGAGAGGAAGSMVGALAGAGMSEERATLYRTAVEEGGIVLVAHPRDPEVADRLEEAWRDAGGKEIYRNV